MRDFVQSKMSIDSQIKEANDILNSLNLKSKNNIEFEKLKKKMRESQTDQIFLGFVALKHHAKKEVNNLISSLT
jgi:magnesium-transporting ATPase (P-type)